MQLNVGHHFIYFVETCLNPSLVAVARDCPGKDPLAAHLLQVIADLAKTPVSNPLFQCTAFPIPSVLLPFIHIFEVIQRFFAFVQNLFDAVQPL